MKNKIILVKCMAKDCHNKIQIYLSQTWYLNENKKRIWSYGRKNELSFCELHTEQFNTALNEMKEVQTKENINKELTETINTTVEKELKKYD